LIVGPPLEDDGFLLAASFDLSFSGFSPPFPRTISLDPPEEVERIASGGGINSFELSKDSFELFCASFAPPGVWPPMTGSCSPGASFPDDASSPALWSTPERKTWDPLDTNQSYRKVSLVNSQRHLILSHPSYLPAETSLAARGVEWDASCNNTLRSSSSIRSRSATCIDSRFPSPPDRGGRPLAALAGDSPRKGKPRTRASLGCRGAAPTSR
jgi:hypothetical protein